MNRCRACRLAAAILPYLGPPANAVPRIHVFSRLRFQVIRFGWLSSWRFWSNCARWLRWSVLTP